MDIGSFYNNGVLVVWLVEEELKLYIDSVSNQLMVELHALDQPYKLNLVIPNHVQMFKLLVLMEVKNKVLLELK